MDDEGGKANTDKPPVAVAAGKVVTGTAAIDVAARVGQVKVDCLKAIYSRDYYKKFLDIYTSRIEYIDLCLAISTGLTGVSGLAILKEPNFGWVCGAITAISLALSGIKKHYKMLEKVGYAYERLQFFEVHSHEMMMFVNDLNAGRAWTKAAEDRYKRILSKRDLTKADKYPDLPLKVRREIQDAIKARLNYKSWWSP
jgi:hypothetical protein